MTNEAQNPFAWKAQTRKISALVGILVFVSASLVMYLNYELFVPFWRYVLPALLGVLSFGLVGALLHQKECEQAIRALPGLEYPLHLLLIQKVIYIYFLVCSLTLFFSGIFFPESFIYKLLGSGYNILIILFALVFVAGGGGQLIAKEVDGDIIYRDTISGSKLSRQDLFFSHCGKWDGGLIIGWKTFSFGGIDSFDETKKSLIIKGKEAEGEYTLILYTPRIQKYCRKVLQDREIL